MQPSLIPWRDAWRFWLKLGFISFGGPAGQIAIMHSEVVERRRWISESRFLHALNYCMLLPGPEAQQLATYLGWLMHGVRGGIVAGVLFVLPSLLLMIALAWIYVAYGQVDWVAGVFYGLKPAVTALVMQAAVRIGGRTLRAPWLWLIAIAAFIGISALKLPFPLIIAIAALLGWLGRRWLPESNASHGTGSSQVVDALIDDASGVPAHARAGMGRLLRVVAVAALCWVLPFLALWLWMGQGTLTQMATFFSRVALVSFGGAYAVLPYVNTWAVQHYGWLQPTQMIDGLALGETTPGPLIMVLVFVGFLGGHAQEAFGAGHALVGGIAGALVTAWFTFLPSFAFIFAGAPWIEATHGDRRFQAPLSGVTAAVVGVILNLALFFALHVLWPSGVAAGFDWKALMLMLAAAVALIVFKRGTVPVLLACAIAGLLLRLLVHP